MKYLPLLLLVIVTPLFTACPFLYGHPPVSEELSPVIPARGTYPKPLIVSYNPVLNSFPEGTSNIWFYYTLDGSDPTISLSSATVAVLRTNFKLTFSTPGVYTIKLFETTDPTSTAQNQILTYTYTVQ